LKHEELDFSFFLALFDHLPEFIESAQHFISLTITLVELDQFSIHSSMIASNWELIVFALPMVHCFNEAGLQN